MTIPVPIIPAKLYNFNDSCYMLVVWKYRDLASFSEIMVLV
jgi:hypothetical protein